MVTAGYKAVRLIYYFTAGVQEVRGVGRRGAVSAVVVWAGGGVAGEVQGGAGVAGASAGSGWTTAAAPLSPGHSRPAPLTAPASPHPAARLPPPLPPPQVRCWQIRDGTKAPQAAGAIHTDFERGFICAEVMAFADMKEHGTESGAPKGLGFREARHGVGCAKGRWPTDTIYLPA